MKWGGVMFALHSALMSVPEELQQTDFGVNATVSPRVVCKSQSVKMQTCTYLIRVQVSVGKYQCVMVLIKDFQDRFMDKRSCRQTCVKS